MPPADVVRTFASIDKARRLLDYHPRIAVDEGAKRFFDWYESLGG